MTLTTATANINKWDEIQILLMLLSKLGTVTIQRQPTSRLVMIVYRHGFLVDAEDHTFKGPEEDLKQLLTECHRVALVLERLR